jgi:hypothetical protein
MGNGDGTMCWHSLCRPLDRWFNYALHACVFDMSLYGDVCCTCSIPGRYCDVHKEWHEARDGDGW